MLKLKDVSKAVRIAKDVTNAAKGGFGNINAAVNKKVKKVKSLAMTLIIINTVIMVISLAAAGVALYLNYKNGKKVKDLEEKLLLSGFYDDEEYDFSLDDHEITEFSEDEEDYE